VNVCLGINGDCLDAQLFASPDNSDGDLAAIGNKYFMKHEGEPLFS
jgi:hypothetical protein